MSQTQFSMKGKTVIVTGGAQGIGFEITRQFLAAGAQVSIWDYSEEGIKKATGELAQYTSQIHTAKVDVSSRDSIANAAASLPWPVEVLVNNAGITRDKSFAKLTPEDWDAVINTNLTGLFNVTKGLLEKFNQNSTQRRIINISSIVGLYGNFGQANYAAAKAGVIGFTKTLARELAKKGFTSNAIAPGFIQTPMTAAMPKEALDAMTAKIPAARLGQPADIANACLFLASDSASYVNGCILNVDGGLTL